MKFRTFLICVSMLFAPFVFAEIQIQVFYFKPSDVPKPTQDKLDSWHDVMIEVQAFYASEMERYGFGPKTFDFNPEIRLIEGRLKRSQYLTADVLRSEIPEQARRPADTIRLVFLGGGGSIMGGQGVATAKCWAFANAPEKVYCRHLLVIIPSERTILPIVAHEIAHGLWVREHAETRIIEGRVDVMFKPLHVGQEKLELEDFAFSRRDAIQLNESEGLSVKYGLKKSIHRNGYVQEIDADVNNDGYVDLSDVLIVRSGIQNSVSYNTDVNNDGTTDEIDVLIVKAKAVEAIAAAAPSLIRRKKLITWGSLKARQ